MSEHFKSMLRKFLVALRANDTQLTGKWIERFEEWLADSGFLQKP